MSWYPKLDQDEWSIRRFEPHGWFVSNQTYWGKTYKDEETGKEYCSGWDAYYLHKNGEVEAYSDYFETRELAAKTLSEFLEKDLLR